MRRQPQVFVILSTACLLSACSSFQPDQPLAVASGFAAHHLCSETFVSGHSPDWVFNNRIAPTGAMKYVAPLMRYEVDTVKQEVQTTVAGLYTRRAAFHEGYGCVVYRPKDGPTPLKPPVPASQATVSPSLPSIAGTELVPPASDDMRRALDRAFAERSEPPYIRTSAVLVLKNGQLVAERYAPGFSADTPILGFSATKSITNALLGILVRQGKLDMHKPAPFAEWADPANPRHTITPDQLLRQTSGLDLFQDDSGFDRNARMLYMERDTAGFALKSSPQHAPGTQWAYADGHFILLSRIIRDAVGGSAEDVAAFAQRELFGPLGMQRTVLEFDATGTPLGSTYSLATGRDWARFGQFYLNDGMSGTQRILPPGWVKYSATHTLDTGYGAGFWVNGVQGRAPSGAPWGMPNVPKDAFWAMGFMGQHVVVVPSEQLVVVRLGVSHHYDGLIKGMDRLVSEVITALAKPNGP